MLTLAYGGHITPLAAGISCLGAVVWEVLRERHEKRWQVWLLLVPGAIWTYLGIQRLAGHNPLLASGDSWTSLWAYIDVLLCPLLALPYVVFRIHERMEGR